MVDQPDSLTGTIEVRNYEPKPHPCQANPSQVPRTSISCCCPSFRSWVFSTHLHTTPSHFYTGVRLDRARELLRQTDMGVMAVGVACGFASSSYFSRAYRARFGLSPKDDRSQAPVNGLPPLPAASRALRTQRLQAKG